MKLATIILVCLASAACNPGAPISPLIAAAREGNAGRITELVKSGDDVNQRGGVNNWTPLMHAVHKNQPAAVRALIDAGADVNLTAGARGGDTALRLAEIDHDSEIVKILHDHGAKTSQ
jgi:ankyrin repeat protein